MDQLPESITLPKLPAAEVSGAKRAREYMESLEVVSDTTFELVTEEVRGAKARWDAVEKIRVSFTKPLNETVKAINAFFKAPLDDLAEAEAIGKRKLVAYRTAQEEKAAEERRRNEEIARKARAEAERKAQEELAKAEAESRRQREEAARQKEAADRAEREAREARERGDREAAAAADRARKEAEEAERKARANAASAEEKGAVKAQAALEKGADVPVAQVTQAPTAAGASVRQTFSVEVVDFLALIKDVAAGNAPTAVLKADTSALNRMAQAAKGEIRYAGIKVVAGASMAIRK